MDKERLVETMRALAARLESQIPEAKLVFEQIHEEKTTPEEGLEQLSTLIMANPELAEKLQVTLEDHGALPESSDEDIDTALANIHKDSKEALAKIGMAPEGLFYRDENDNKVKLNPLYQTAVMERLQFDEDIPELRMGGDLPRGQMAAVPVEHEGTSSVSLGLKLKKASEEVTQEIEDLRKQRENATDLALAQAAEATLGNDPNTKALAVSAAQTAIAELSKPLDVPGYERGKKAAIRKVEVSGSELAQLSVEEQRSLAYKAVSTTQGRRSSIPTILKIVSKSLEKEGYEVQVTKGWSPLPTLATASWTFSLNIGPMDTNPNFSPIMAASAAIGSNLAKILVESEVPKGTEINVEVNTINDYGERVVGWKAQVLLSRDRPSLEETQ